MGFEEKWQSRWNMMDQELRIIDRTRKLILDQLRVLPFNVLVAPSLHNDLVNYKLCLNPTLDNRRTKTIHKDLIESIEGKLKKTDDLVAFEVNRANRLYKLDQRVRGASRSLVAALQDVFNDINCLKEKLGLGILKEKHYTEMDKLRKAAK